MHATYIAAVLACGDGAVLRGFAAAFLLGLIRRRIVPLPEVAAPRRCQREGIAIRIEALPLGEWRFHELIPVTTPARTVVDLAPELSDEVLARVVHEADVRFGTTPDEVEAVLARRRNVAGAARIRRVVEGDTPLLLSRLEKAFLSLLKQERLPLPITNRPVGAKYVDCRWREHKLTVELDSYRYHRSRHRWEQDHRREREARARGDEFRRYTWHDVHEEPGQMLAELRVLFFSEAAA